MNVFVFVTETIAKDTISMGDHNTSPDRSLLRRERVWTFCTQEQGGCAGQASISYHPQYSVCCLCRPCNDTSKCMNPPRYDSDVVLYNEVAKEVVVRVWLSRVAWFAQVQLRQLQLFVCLHSKTRTQIFRLLICTLLFWKNAGEKDTRVVTASR